jgi:hypothetical protein
MRHFSSYGPVETDLHYYVPRQELVDRACPSCWARIPPRGATTSPSGLHGNGARRG